MNRKPIFDAVRKLLGRPFEPADVTALDKAIDAAQGGLPASELAAAPAIVAAPGGRTLGTAGGKIIKKWEGCEKRQGDGTFKAYPDPGSADGVPWTIGWGSTGADVRKGTVWTQAQCDARFDEEIKGYANAVAKALGTAPTSQNQFDALVSFHYNTGAIASATLTKLHKAGKFAQAQAQFANWIYNNHKPMTGLRNRRAEEAKLYGTV